jgi:phospholipid transport system transporter-binding protein
MSAQLDSGRLVLEGHINNRTAARLLEIGLPHIRAGVEVVDFEAVEDVDSSAVAMALQWVREAQANQRKLRFVNLPDAFVNLTRLYNVSDLFTARA